MHNRFTFVTSLIWPLIEVPRQQIKWFLDTCHRALALNCIAAGACKLAFQVTLKSIRRLIGVAYKTHRKSVQLIRTIFSHGGGANSPNGVTKLMLGYNVPPQNFFQSGQVLETSLQLCHPLLANSLFLQSWMLAWQCTTVPLSCVCKPIHIIDHVSSTRINHAD